MTSATERIPIVIIGAGFGGIAMAMALRRAGEHNFVMLERAADVGGVWRDNSYPGAACDVVSRIYSYSRDQDYEWSTIFAPQPEILDYIRGVVAKQGVRGHIRFNTEVTSAQFDEERALWRIETASGGFIETPVLISAVGLFNRAKIPDFPGRDSFKGPQFHSSALAARCRFDGENSRGDRQRRQRGAIHPEIAAQVKQLYLFQRTPQYVLPRTIFPGTGEWDARLQRHRWLRGLARLKIFLAFEKFVWRRKWRPNARLKGEAGFRAMLAAKIADPVLRAKLTPNFPIGCKRQLVSNEWFDTLIRPNVEVIDTADRRHHRNRPPDQGRRRAESRRHRLRYRLHADANIFSR